MNQSIDLKDLKLTIPAPWGFNNWSAIKATHVMLGNDSWLVVSWDGGQDNISKESVAYYDPGHYPDEWVNRDYDDVPVHFTYQWSDPFFYDRKLLCKKVLEIDEEVETEEVETVVYKLIAPGCGAINNYAKIYLNGMEIERYELPTLHRIHGIHEMWFYRQYYPGLAGKVIG